MNGKKIFAKAKKKGYEPPEWFKKLKHESGDHGSGKWQKKAWRLISEYVRRRDYNEYAGKCVSCWRRMDSWKEGQAAHFISFSLCNGLFKFSPKNLALSCPYCNSAYSGKAVGHVFGEELKRRHGNKILDVLNDENIYYHGKKIELWELVDFCKPIYEELQELRRK